VQPLIEQEFASAKSRSDCDEKLRLPLNFFKRGRVLVVDQVEPRNRTRQKCNCWLIVLGTSGVAPSSR
jgi:hypothetical protein